MNDDEPSGIIYGEVPPATGGTGGYAAGGGLRVILSPVPGYTEGATLRGQYVFQCPPTEEISYGFAHTHTDYDTLGMGQLSRAASRQLRTVTFSALFVDYDAPWILPEADASVTPPGHAQILRAICENGSPVRIVVHNYDLWSTPDVDMAATLRSVQITERAGEVDARYAQVEFREFRAADLQEKIIKPPSRKTPAVVQPRTLPAGRDTLSELAKFYYGSASRTAPIRKANPALRGVGNNQDLNTVFAKRPTVRLKIPSVS